MPMEWGSCGWLSQRSASAVFCSHGDSRSVCSSRSPAVGVVCWYVFVGGTHRGAIVGVIFGLLCPAEPFHDPEPHRPEARGARGPLRRCRPSVGAPRKSPRTCEKFVTARSDRASPERAGRRSSSCASLRACQCRRQSVDQLDLTTTYDALLGVGWSSANALCCGVHLARTRSAPRPPERTTWSHVVGIGATAGIGFTVALVRGWPAASTNLTLPPLGQDRHPCGEHSFKVCSATRSCIASCACDLKPVGEPPRSR